MNIFKNKFLVLGLVATFLFTACGDGDIEPGPRSTPVTPAITGGAAVSISPNTVTYSVLVREGSTYDWSVTGVGSISSSEGNSAKLLFTTAGTTTLTVTESNDKGTADPVSLVITSSVAKPATTRIFSLSKNSINQGSTDDIVIVFDRELTTPPSVALLAGAGVTDRGSLGAVSQLAMTDTTAYDLHLADLYDVASLSAYTVEYTGGAGDGTPSIEVTNAVATTAWGGGTMAKAVGSISTLDNTDATISSVAFDHSTAVSSGGSKPYTIVGEASDSVKVTITFKESIDTTAVVMLSGSGTGSVPDMDAVAMTFSKTDNSVWWAYFDNSGNASLIDGDGSPDFTVTGVEDWAGNQSDDLDFGGLMVDNTAPTVHSTGAYEITSDADAAILEAASTENGELFYTLYKDSDDSIITGGSVSTTGGDVEEFTTSILVAGDYYVTFYSVDLVGNVGETSSRVDFTID